ncbi:MAG: hypothetical protein IJZ72_06735 [Oscillospiraceae bacterium]|nr:hypothetical protein [Oscillospiraceae bacterium]
MLTKTNSALSSVYMLDRNGMVKGNLSFRQIPQQTVSSDESYEETYRRISQKAKADGIELADISERKNPVYTCGVTSINGNPQHPEIEVMNKVVRLGMAYKKSCFDFTNVRDFDKITAQQTADGFDELSDSDKYRLIYEKYQHCYGENFIYADSVEYIMPAEEDPYLDIIRKFRSELTEIFGSTEKIASVCREAYYGGMSDFEIRQSIIEKYSEGGITQYELFKIGEDMAQCGVGAGLITALNPIGNPTIYHDPLSSEHYALIRERQLDELVTRSFMNDLISNYENRLLCGGYMPDDHLEVLCQVMAEI